MIAGELVIDGFGYGVADEEAPIFDGDGVPVGTQKLKILLFEPHDSQARISVRFTLEQWDTFVERCQARRITVAGPEALAHFRNGNGG